MLDKRERNKIEEFKERNTAPGLVTPQNIEWLFRLIERLDDSCACLESDLNDAKAEIDRLKRID